MRRRAAGAGLATTLGVAALGGTGLAPADAALITVCRGTAGAVTVPNELAVPANASCDLTGTTIIGNVTVRSGATLVMDGVTVTGNLVVQANGYADATDSSVAGTTRLNRSFGLSAEGSTLGGAVTATTGGFFYAVDSDLGAQLRSTAGETVLETVRVAGSVTTTGDTLTDLYDSTVRGGVDVMGPLAGAAVCDSEVDGRLLVRGAGGVVSVGDGVVGECGAVYVGGELVLQDNTAGVHVSGSIVRGATTCERNDPAPVGSGNRMRGGAGGQCAELAPALAAQARSSEPQLQAQADRTAAVAERAATRTAAGETAAALTGDAGLGG